MQIVSLNNNYVRQTTYVLIEGHDAIVIDPGFNGKAIRQMLEEYGASVEAVLLTHVHYDHIRDVKMIETKTKIPLYFHPEETEFFTDGYKNYAKAFSRTFRLPDRYEKKPIDHQEPIRFKNHIITAHHTPGHTVGSLSYAVGNNLFSGDTLFFDSVGRTDLYSGEQTRMKQSIDYLLKNFDDDTVVYPGHGKSATLAIIKENNPYL